MSNDEKGILDLLMGGLPYSPNRRSGGRNHYNREVEHTGGCKKGMKPAKQKYFGGNRKAQRRLDVLTNTHRRALSRRGTK